MTVVSVKCADGFDREKKWCYVDAYEQKKPVRDDF